jgi:hypothetical protein
LPGRSYGPWILELRATLSPISVAGYVRTLKVFGNWLAADRRRCAAMLHNMAEMAAMADDWEIEMNSRNGGVGIIGVIVIVVVILFLVGVIKL